MAGWAVLNCFAPLLLQAAPDRLVARIDEHRLAIFGGPSRPVPERAVELGRADDTLVLSSMALRLTPSPAQKRELEQLLERQRDPGSPEYRQWLTPEQFGERFGASLNDLEKLQQWLQTLGFKAENVARSRNRLFFSGTAGLVSRAFHTEIHQYRLEGGEIVFANPVPASIPEALEAVLEGIEGLDNYRWKPSRTRVFPASAQYSSGGTHYLAPADFATIFNTSPLVAAGFDGTGQKIVIAGQSEIDIADIQAFRAQFALPPNDPQVILSGASPGVSEVDKVESDLDLEWAGAVAPGAKLIYVYSKNVISSVQYAVDQNLAPVISLSYGGCEQRNTPALRLLAQQANAQGITWVAASGDSGAAACDAAGSVSAANGLAVLYPASIPEVTAVGGTTLDDKSRAPWGTSNNADFSSATGYIPESAWNDVPDGNGLWATGGGASIFFAKPAWQTGAGVPDDRARDLPDLSLPASVNHGGYFLFSGGVLEIAGGTSASTPAFSGMVALLNHYLVAQGVQAQPGLGNINPSLYRLARTSPLAFHDIVDGGNIVPCTAASANCAEGRLGYAAGPGYDLATGLGSVNAANLITSWSALPTSIATVTNLSAVSDTTKPEAATLLTVKIRAGSGSLAPTGAVTFQLGDLTLATLPLQASGSESFAAFSVSGDLLSGSLNNITAVYAGNASFAASSAALTILGASAPPNSSRLPRPGTI